MICTMRRLIINADDLGINRQRSHGIFICAEQGAVTSVSLIPNGTDSEDAGRRAGERDIPTGLHLNLTEGPPVSDAASIKSLLTTDGYFLGLDALKRALSLETVDKNHIEREIRSQIEWFLQTRGHPTHVDGHHHIHVHPLIAQSLVGILDHYGIAFIRIPSEPSIPFGYEIEPKRSAFIAALSEEAERARKLFSAHGIRGPEHFRGLALSGKVTMRNIRHTLGRLPDGTTELMVHPGSLNPSGSPFDADPQRQTEMQTLLSDDTKAELGAREIKLCSYADLY